MNKKHIALLLACLLLAGFCLPAAAQETAAFQGLHLKEEAWGNALQLTETGNLVYLNRTQDDQGIGVTDALLCLDAQGDALWRIPLGFLQPLWWAVGQMRNGDIVVAFEQEGQRYAQFVSPGGVLLERLALPEAMTPILAAGDSLYANQRDNTTNRLVQIARDGSVKQLKLEGVPPDASLRWMQIMDNGVLLWLSQPGIDSDALVLHQLALVDDQGQLLRGIVTEEAPGSDGFDYVAALLPDGTLAATYREEGNAFHMVRLSRYDHRGLLAGRLLVSGACHTQRICLIQPQADGSLMLWGDGNRQPARDGFVYQLHLSAQGQLLESRAWQSEGTPRMRGDQVVVWDGWQEGNQQLLPLDALPEIHMGFSVTETLP